MLSTSSTHPYISLSLTGRDSHLHRRPVGNDTAVMDQDDHNPTAGPSKTDPIVETPPNEDEAATESEDIVLIDSTEAAGDGDAATVEHPSETVTTEDAVSRGIMRGGGEGTVGLSLSPLGRCIAVRGDVLDLYGAETARRRG
jgi:hypothetical protein